MTHRLFEELDRWTSEQVAEFKESARLADPERAARALGTRAFGIRATGAISGRIVAEGDSWFDYPPGTDLIDCLKILFHYDIENYAKAGDTLENMIFGTGINRRYQRVAPQIDRILARIAELRPKVFLFSGGGNDVAGDEFESYLNHKHSGLPALREQLADDMINRVFRTYFEDLIDRVALRSPATHIVTHGYGHTIPTGEGVDLLFFTFAGPWLRPALAKKGIFDQREQRNIVFGLIDTYNDMLASLDREHETFHHVDLRPILDPERDWANELHLKNSAYARSALEIHNLIQEL